MKNLTKKLILMMGVVFLAFAAAPATAQTTDEVTALVKQTKVAMEKNTLQTLARINRAEHPYKNKDNPSLYVFVFDIDLTVVGHPIKTAVIGKNVAGKPDIKGKNYRDDMRAMGLKQGGGWVDYYFENPKTKKVEHKNTYFEVANGSDGKKYLVGSGKYFDK